MKSNMQMTFLAKNMKNYVYRGQDELFHVFYLICLPTRLTCSPFPLHFTFEDPQAHKTVHVSNVPCGHYQKNVPLKVNNFVICPVIKTTKNQPKCIINTGLCGGNENFSLFQITCLHVLRVSILDCRIFYGGLHRESFKSNKFYCRFLLPPGKVKSCINTQTKKEKKIIQILHIKFGSKTVHKKLLFFLSQPVNFPFE